MGINWKHETNLCHWYIDADVIAITIDADYVSFNDSYVLLLLLMIIFYNYAAIDNCHAHHDIDNHAFDDYDDVYVVDDWVIVIDIADCAIAFARLAINSWLLSGHCCCAPH